MSRLLTINGVDSAAFTSFNDGMPLDGDGRSTGVLAESRAGNEGAAATREIQYASPQFFETLGTPSDRESHL